LANKQEELVRYDQDLHEIEIQSKYAKEECMIQEKEIIRLNAAQEEQGNRIKTLQQDLLKLQEEVNYFNRRRISALRYRVLSEDSFDKPDIFPTTIASYSSGQKASLTQSSSV
jgi:chromosome segregation ATPase